MIEVEKNFNFSPENKERLLQEASFIEKKVFTDIYYDGKDYKLTKKDYWLRQRSGKWELKAPLSRTNIDERITDQYYELSNKEEIAKVLKINFGVFFDKSAQGFEFLPFATITTTRETYQKGDFHLDFDEMDFGFSTLEVEIMVEKESDVALAERRIMEFAEIYGLQDTKARGKVIEYIFLNNKDHYNALVLADIIKN